MRTLSALLAVACLLAFLGILVWKVPRPDLAAVVGVTVLLALADVVSQLRRKP